MIKLKLLLATFVMVFFINANANNKSITHESFIKLNAHEKTELLYKAKNNQLSKKEVTKISEIFKFLSKKEKIKINKEIKQHIEQLKDNVKYTKYLCVAETAGGLTYDKILKRWKGTEFSTDSKYIVKIPIKNTINKLIQKDISAHVIEVGETDILHNCKIEYSDIIYTCGITQTGMVFNKTTMRYIKHYLLGYHWGNVDGDVDTPYIEGGKCSPL